MGYKLYDQVLVKVSHTPVLRGNATVNGASIDRWQSSPQVNQFNTVMFLILTGTVTDGSNVFTVEHSDDGSSWGSAASFLHGTTPPTVVAANDDTFYELGYHGDKRFVRLVSVTTGAVTGGVWGAVAILGNARKSFVRNA